MRNWMLAAFVIGAGLVGGGCASNAPSSSSAGARHAECLVCKHENDLACVDVVVDDKTPRATIAGKEYFFCSDECKQACVKSPQKYLSTK